MQHKLQNGAQHIKKDDFHLVPTAGAKTPGKKGVKNGDGLGAFRSLNSPRQNRGKTKSYQYHIYLAPFLAHSALHVTQAEGDSEQQAGELSSKSFLALSPALPRLPHGRA